MTSSTGSESLGKLQRIFLLVVGVALTGLLFFLRGGFDSQAPLDQLARRSIDPEIALSNGNPTIYEFYADWCEACKEMAPAMLTLERKYVKKINFVMLNVDNKLWQDLIGLYEVNGIPQLNFFDSNGNSIGKTLGIKTEAQLDEIMDAMSANQSLESFDYLSIPTNLSALSSGNISTRVNNKPGRPTDHK